MAGGGYGGSSGNQSGNQSGDYTGNTTGTSSGSYNGNTSGTTAGTTTGSTTGSTSVNTTPIFNTASQGAAGAINPNGMTAGQQQGYNFLSGTVAGQPMGWALQGVNKNIDSITGTPLPTVSTGPVIAGSAASFMSPYENAYANDVLNPTLASFDNDTAQQAAQLRAGRDAGSAFGDRSAIADSVFGGQRALARGQLAGQVTGQGFNTAVGAGQADAANNLVASGQNAANTLTASGQNAANVLTGRSQALQGTAQQAGNDVNTNTMGVGNAQALFNAGAAPLANWLSLAGSQVPAFGASTAGSTTGSSTGTQAGTSSGTQTGDTSGTQSGGYSGQSSGVSSGSQGGMHIGK